MEGKNVGKVIRDRREELHLSLQKVGNHVGVNRSTLCRWESGEIKGIKSSHIYRLCEILHLPVEALLDLNAKVTIEDANVVIERNKVIECLNDIKNIEDLKQVYKFITVFLK